MTATRSPARRSSSKPAPLKPALAELGIGGTPLLAIRGLSPALGKKIQIWAKAEWHNPGGSVKDRAAGAIILEARAAGRLSAGRRLLDATSGNTGIAYAWIGARLGIPVSLAVPGSLSARRREILEALGTELFFTDPLEGSDGAIREARLLSTAEPGRYHYVDQYNNPSNWRAHFETTGPEIWRQTKGAVTHLVAGLGTSGTFTGAGRRLKALKPSLRLISVEPDGPMHGLEGLKHIATAIVPGIYDHRLADERMSVATEEAQGLARRAAKSLGLLLGPSGAANLVAALRVAQAEADAGRPAVIVTVLPDSGERYLGERFWREG